VQETQETMAKTKVRGESSRAIRDYFSKNPAATGQEVVEGLKAKGMTVTVGLVYNVKAYDAKKKSKKKAAKAAAKAGATATKADATSTNGATTGTKADAIRSVAKSLPKPFRPRDVRVELAKQGIDATTTFIGKVLRSAGMKRKRRRKAAAGNGAPAVANNSLNINDLVAAKKVVEQVGSVEKVREALVALGRLG